LAFSQVSGQLVEVEVENPFLLIRIAYHFQKSWIQKKARPENKGEAQVKWPLLDRITFFEKADLPAFQ